MAPVKFVIKCGNFAVLVDLHVLPLGGQEDTSWFSMDYVEEVTSLVQDAVDKRVKQYAESLQRRRQPKQTKDLAPASALFVKGKSFHLVANFLKRHINLRCIAKQQSGDLRVFPERYVVCMSRPEDASAHHGNLSLATIEQSEQSRSEYFSRAGETQDPLNSPAKTKKTLLQKIAKHASVQQEETAQKVGLKIQSEEHRESESSPNKTVPCSGLKMDFSESMAQIVPTGKLRQMLKEQIENNHPDSNSPNGVSLVSFEYEASQGVSKRWKPNDIGDDPYPQKAKRTCLGGPPATTEVCSPSYSVQTSRLDDLPLTSLPPVEAKTGSKAFPVSEWKKTTVEVELLTLGKQAQRLSLTSNNTAQTNQNRLATSLRGLSVKPASSGSSINSRSTFREEGRENVPRTSRLQRLKRSGRGETS